MKTVTTNTFKTLIEQLKENEKQGNTSIVSLTLNNGYFRAVLEEGENSKYSKALSSLTGDETDNIQDKIDFLLSVEDSQFVKDFKGLDKVEVVLNEQEYDALEKAVAQQTEPAEVPVAEIESPTPKPKRTRKKAVKKGV